MKVMINLKNFNNGKSIKNLKNQDFYAFQYLSYSNS